MRPTQHSPQTWFSTLDQLFRCGTRVQLMYDPHALVKNFLVLKMQSVLSHIGYTGDGQGWYLMGSVQVYTSIV